MHTKQGMGGGRKAFLLSILSAAASFAAAALGSSVIHTTTSYPSAFANPNPKPSSLLHRCGFTSTTTTTSRLGLAFVAAAARSTSSFFLSRCDLTTTRRHMTADSSIAPPPALKTKVLTLLFVRRTNPTTGAKEVLLGMKKRGFGIGKWNGFGGKVEPGETIEAAALRELEEESCVKASGVELRGKITFTFLTIPEVLKVSVFEAVGPMVGEPQETEEMMPRWYAESEIPFEKMWADDKYWVPLFLEGKRFRALFEFDDESTILRYDLDTVKDGEEL